MSHERPVFPFTAIVGQGLMKKALILNAINPRIGGVLIRGEKGTAKSTAVRAFARLLPDIAVVEGCRYGCDPDAHSRCAGCADLPYNAEISTVSRRVPLVELPVGATEDRVVGTLNIEHAIKEGERVFEPGLLAAANRGILYVDEVNLLGDHLVDVLLDAAAMGRNYVEREGISVSHPAAFILVGTMNPEEGDLRPQLLDRFALAVEVEGLRDPEERAEVVRRRIAFEADPEGFAAQWQGEEESERERIASARERLTLVRMPDGLIELISRICAAYEIDGLRGDIVVYKTALTFAAYAGRDRVLVEDIRQAAELALVHRRRRQPFDNSETAWEQLQEILRLHAESGQDGEGEETGGDDGGDGREHQPPGGSSTHDQVTAPGEPYAVRPLAPPACPRSASQASGRRTPAVGESRGGRYIGARAPGGQGPVSMGSLALDATIRAAAPFQNSRRAARPDGPNLLIAPEDVREKIRETKVGNLVLFCVDASGSMAARQRMVAVKGAVLALLLDAYQKRDRVGLIAFRGTAASLVLPPTNSVEQAERQLRSLPTGGRTPLAQALKLSLETLDRQSSDAWLPWLVLVSDGRPNVPLEGGDPMEDACCAAGIIKARGIRSLLIDTENGPVRLGLNRRIAEALGAEYLRLEELAAHSIDRAVRRRVRPTHTLN
ncbi:MAG: magnesium chelatase subunit D family protein [Chloroflexota bacterium]|nr:magnesium chelatase subunit D family protein [Chloroflexota bacterium]